MKIVLKAFSFGVNHSPSFWMCKPTGALGMLSSIQRKKVINYKCLLKITLVKTFRSFTCSLEMFRTHVETIRRCTENSSLGD